MTAAAAAHASAVRAVSWRDVPTEQVQHQAIPGVTRQVVSGERQTIVRSCYQPGAVVPEHQHPQEPITIVLRGQIEFAIAGRRHALAAGDLLVIPGGMPHGARVRGDEVVETISTLSPRRDDHPGR